MFFHGKRLASKRLNGAISVSIRKDFGHRFKGQPGTTAEIRFSTSLAGQWPYLLTGMDLTNRLQSGFYSQGEDSESKRFTPTVTRGGTVH